MLLLLGEYGDYLVEPVKHSDIKKQTPAAEDLNRWCSGGGG